MQNYYGIYFKFILGASLLALGMAYFFEYVVKLIPCKMCYYQRYAYFAVIAFCIIGYALKNYRHILAWFVMAGLLASLGLAFTHLGVESGWFELEMSCTSRIHSYVDSLDEFRDMIMAKDNVPCDIKTFAFLGVSIAGWNFAYSGLLVVLSALLLYVFQTKTIKYED